MKKIMVYLPSLIRKVQEMADDNMDYVMIDISEEVVDQYVYYPAFIHFEAFDKGGSIMDYESIDSVLSQILLNANICSES